MSHAHRPEFDALADHVREALAGRPAIFFINPGNWGDSMIREGAETFLRHYDIPYHLARFKDVIKGRTTLADLKAATHHADPAMIYNGCGAFSPHYALLPRVAELSREFSTAIFLPATFAMDVDRSAFAKDTHFFVRDKFQSQSRMPDCAFCHDMAFFLSVIADPARKELGNFFRVDVEAPAGVTLPKDNLDISKLGRAHTPVDRLLEGIGQYQKVRTNRLHVGIAATLLGRDTQIFTNDYFKIKAIFDSSIDGYFSNASYHQSYDALDV